jgi:hypothetical protein
MKSLGEQLRASNLVRAERTADALLKLIGGAVPTPVD